MGVRQLLPSRGKDTNATLSSFSSSCLFFNDDQEEEGRKRAMSNEFHANSTTFHSSSWVATSSRWSIDPAQLSLSEYKLHKNLNDTSTFKEYGHSVHSAGTRRRSLTQGKLIGGYGILPNTAEELIGSSRRQTRRKRKK